MPIIISLGCACTWDELLDGMGAPMPCFTSELLPLQTTWAKMANDNSSGIATFYLEKTTCCLGAKLSQAELMVTMAGSSCP